LLTFIDECKALDKLPKYVADSPEGMPTLRLYEGDLQVLIEILWSLSGRMDCFETSLAAIAKHVQAVQVWPSLLGPAVSRNLGQQVQAGRQQQQPAAESGWSRSGSYTVSYRSADYVQSPLRPLPTMDWSAQTSTLVAQSNRFAALATEGEEDRDDDSDAGPYTMVQRGKKRDYDVIDVVWDLQAAAGAVSVSGCVATDVCDVTTETNPPKVEDNAPEDVDSLPTNQLHPDDLVTFAQKQEQNPTLAPCWVQAQTGKRGFVVNKDILYHKDQADGQSVCQLCGSFITIHRVSNVTQVGTTARSMPVTNHSSSEPKRNLKCSMSHGAYAVVMLCVLCVLMIACVAQCFVTDDRDVMFGRVLTPTPVVLSAVLFSQQSSLSRQDDKIAHLFTTHTKKDGGVRIAGDYRYLNSFTVGDACPMPTINEVLCSISKGQFISTFDARSDYWQIPLAE